MCRQHGGLRAGRVQPGHGGPYRRYGRLGFRRSAPPARRQQHFRRHRGRSTRDRWRRSRILATAGSSSDSAGAPSGGSSGGFHPAALRALCFGDGTSGSAGSSGSGQSTGGGTGAQGCSHPQPGAVTTGLVVQYQDDAAGASVLHDLLQHRNRQSRRQPRRTVSDLRFRYYFNNDLTTPVTDFYSPQTKDAQGITHNPDADALWRTRCRRTSRSPAFLRRMPATIGDSLMFQVHMHSDPNPGSHDQSMDYSYSPSTTLMPWCHVIAYQQTALAVGYATARLTACYAERWRVAFTL